MTDETKRNRNRKTDPGVAKPAGRMAADDLFADDTADIDVPVYRRDRKEGAVEGGAVPKPRRDIYDVLGRARPQRITPPTAESKSSDQPAPNAQPVLNAEPAPNAQPERRTEEPATLASGADEQPTTVIPTAGRGQDSGSRGHNSAGKGTAKAVGVGAGPAGQSATTQPQGSDDTVVFPEANANPHRGDVHPAESALAPAEPQAAAAVGTDAAVVEGDPATDVHVHDKRGTTGFGLFLLRLVAGALLLVYGLQTLFAFGGNPGLNAFEGLLTQYKYADLLAVGLSIGQVAAGGLLILGLLTPVGAAVGAIVSAFMAGHYMGMSGGNLWPYALSPQTQLWSLLALICLALIFTGPGRISVDRNRGWARRPLASAWIFAIIAIGAAAALWIVVGGGNPAR
ncbi:DoxX family protein [Corynebacterium sp. HMSC28B08]|uniref:DoxX family protein n=1 Tax=Corynebacterium sp. HMSC28B08 TaxID=1581066 RepID=UPI001FED99B6|nr:DoxX family protein [Corynebacterium sp. HMSC28B08]